MAHTEFSPDKTWNGILGKMKLVAVDPVYVEDMQLYPDVARKAVKVKMIIKNHTQKPVPERQSSPFRASSMS